MHAVHEEHALPQPRNGLFHRRLVKRLPAGCAFKTFHHAHLVAFGLQAADKPRAGVGESAVVEIDRVLRRQHDAQPVGACLLEQGEQQHFAGRVRHRRHVAEQFVDVENGPQRAGAGLRAHPCQNVRQQERHEEHALGVTKVRDGDDGALGPAVRVVQQIGRVERFALEPVLKARGREQVVESHGELHAILGREHCIQWHHTHLRERWRLNAADDPREIEITPLAPRGRQQIRQQDMLAAGDRIGFNAEEREYTRGGRVDMLAQRFAVVANSGRRRDERAQQRERAPGRAARCVDGHVGGVDQSLNACAILAPAGQSVAPCRRLRGRELIGGYAGVGRLLWIHPRAEVRGGQRRKAQREIAQIALGVDGDYGHFVDQRFFQQTEPEAGLAAARHADDHGVRREILGVIQDVVVLPFAGGEVVALAEVEGAQFLEVRH